MRFNEHLISGDFNYAFGISAADINNNGSLDIVAADTGVGLYWFENDGVGNFIKHIIHRRSDEWLERHAIADINGDGRSEIVIVDNLNGSVLWFEYDGDPRDEKSWSHHYICEGGLSGAYDVAVADLDDDGDLDVVMALGYGDNDGCHDSSLHEIVWCENDGYPELTPWKKHVICKSFVNAFEAFGADLDGVMGK